MTSVTPLPSAASCAGIARSRSASRLHQLSTFMGHVDPTSTAVYLTITPALLEEANQRFEASPNKHGPTRGQRNDRLQPVAWAMLHSFFVDHW